MKPTSLNGPQSVSPQEVAEWVEKHYAHVMVPWQLDLTKRLISGMPVDSARINGKTITHRIINEAFAVLQAQKASSEGIKGVSDTQI